MTAKDNWWGCNGAAIGTGCDTEGITTGSTGTVAATLSPYTTLTLALSTTTPVANSSFTATGSLGQDSNGTVYAAASDTAYIGATAAIGITQHGGSTTLTNTPGTTLGTVASPAESAGIQAVATATSAGTGLASVTVDGCTVKDTGASPTCNSSTTTNFTVTGGSPTLSVTSIHTGNFKAGDTADTYTLTVSNSGGATSGTVTLTDTLPSGFTATALGGTGWTCTLGTLTCTRSDALAGGASYPVVTLTVSVSSSDAGTYSNSVSASGGGATGTSTGTDSTVVVAPPVLGASYQASPVATGSSNYLSISLTNPSANTVSLTGVAFSSTLPLNLTVSSTPNTSTTCFSGTIAAVAGSSTFSFSGGTISVGTTCTVLVYLTPAAAGSYTVTTTAPTSGNANAGTAASASFVASDATSSTVSIGATTGTVGGTTTASIMVTDTSTGATPAGTVTFYNTVNGATTTIATVTLSGGAGSTTYNESYGGSNVVTATYTPASSSFLTSSDNTGKTIAVAKASPSQTANALNETVPRNVASTLAIIFSYPGKVPPSGAITATINGAAVPGTPTCTYKTTGPSPHSNCTLSFTTTLADGQYPLVISEAADNNYTAFSESSTLTVTN